MSISWQGRTAVMTAAGDTLTGRKVVSKIHITSVGTVSGPVKLRENGASGALILDGDTVQDDTVSVTQGMGQPIRDLYVEALPTGAEVLVQTLPN